MNRGFIKLARRSFSHYLWTEKRSLSKFEAWLDLLQLAAHSPTRRIIRGHVVEIGRGEIIASLRYLGERWSWKKDKVASFLGLIEQDQMIRRSTRQQETVVTVCNYDKYNSASDTDPDNESDTKPTAARQLPDKDKKEKKDKKDTPLPPEGDGTQGDFHLEIQTPTESGRILPENWKRLGQTDQKRTRVHRNSPAMIRIGALLNRRADNLWTVAEAVSLLKLKPTEDEIDHMEEFYTAIIPPDPITGKNQDFRRRSLSVLLNNWNDELDKARLWKSEQHHKTDT